MQVKDMRTGKLGTLDATISTGGRLYEWQLQVADRREAGNENGRIMLTDWCRQEHLMIRG